MTTRYSLPSQVQEADTARGGRIIAALALVVTVISLSLRVLLLPAAEPDVAAAPDGDAAAAPVVTGA